MQRLKSKITVKGKGGGGVKGGKGDGGDIQLIARYASAS